MKSGAQKIHLYNMNSMFIFFVLSLSFLFLFNSSSVNAQDDIRQLVKQVQQNNKNLSNNIQSLYFTGKSKYFASVTWDAIDLKSIPEYNEFYFEGYWSKPDSLRIKIKALRIAKTEHPFYYNSEYRREDYHKRLKKKPILPNPFRFQDNFSLLGLDRGTRKGKNGSKVPIWPDFPFSAGADSLYEYEYLSEISVNGRKIVKILVSPKHTNKPGISGTYLVDPIEKVIVGSDIVFNDHARILSKDTDNGMTSISTLPFSPFSHEEGHYIKTTKNLYDVIFWLPDVIEEDYYLDMFGFRAKTNKIIEFHSFVVNPTKDIYSSFEDSSLVYDIDPILEKKLFIGLPDPNILPSFEQDSIFNSIRSSAYSKNLNNEIFDFEGSAKNALKFSLEQKSRKYTELATKWGENFVYNPVEGLRLNYRLDFSNIILNKSNSVLNLGLGLKDEKVKAEFSNLFFFDEGMRFFLENNYYSTLSYMESKYDFPDGKNTFSSLFYCTDYRDYFYTEGGSISLGFRFNDHFALKVSGVSQNERNAYNNTRFSIFRYNNRFKPNPEIMEGRFTGGRFNLVFRSADIDADIYTEFSDKGLLESDFSYKFLKTNIRARKKINKHNHTFITLSGGTSSGNLPAQKWFDIGGKSLFNYHGNLRGVGYKEFTGDKMFKGIFEHTLLYGELYDIYLDNNIFKKVLKALKLNLWAGYGYSEISAENLNYTRGILIPRNTASGGYREYGIGIGDQLNFVRLDYITNSISDNKILFSINVFR